MNDEPRRVNHYPGQFLRSQDFVDEQRYHLTAQRRHHLAHHSWGIAMGLEIVASPELGLGIGPGVAIDGFGRELVVRERLPLDPRMFTRYASDSLAIWLTYERTAAEPDLPAWCDPADFVRTGDRWLEDPLVVVTVPTPGGLDPRRPPDLTAEELAFDAAGTPPDAPEEDWWVFLGLVRREPPGSDPLYVIDGRQRPYIGLVADRIETPAKDAWLRLGHDPDVTGDPVFAVHVDVSDEGEPALSVDRQGQTTVRGDTTVYGAVEVDGGAVTLRVAGDAKTSHPFGVYQVAIPEAALTAAEDGEDLPPPGSELRIEVPAEGKIVFGTWSTSDRAFKPCLTISAGYVRVHGDLIVDGTIPQRVGSMRLDATARGAAIAGVVAGAIAGVDQRRATAREFTVADDD